MKTPPLLLGAALLFWGWQSDYLAAGAVMAILLESARLIKARVEFSDEDFNRIWTLCAVLFLGAAVYAFTANEGPSRFGDMFQNPSLVNQSSAGTATARTVTALFRWLPLIFFLFVAAQAYSTREEIPWTTISQISRWRWKRAGRRGEPRGPARGVNVAFAYFGLCLFAAGTHASDNSRYFWGVSALLAWALWSRRSRRYRAPVWLATLALAVGLGYVGQRSVGRLQSYLSNLNPEMFSWLARGGTDPDRSRTSIGRIGRLKQSGQIVIRLKPEKGGVPTYLREASYRIYDTGLWYASVAKERFESVYETNGTTWYLLTDKTNIARAQIACYLEGVSPETRNPIGLLPLPEGSGRLENLPAFALGKNKAGAVLAEGPGLVIFEACYGPGASIDSAPDHSLDLYVPPSETNVLDRVLAEAQATGTNTDQTLQALNGFFQTKFSYRTWQDRPRPAERQETPLTRFLLSTRSGHCEYFATATVLLLRRAGIPARYAVGYAVHEPAGAGFVVRQRDAHAWCLVWDAASRTWQDFDTTPPSWVETESQRASPWQWVSDLWSRAQFEFSKFRWGQTHIRRYLLFVLVPVLALLLYQILFRRKRTRRRRDGRARETPIAWPGRDSEFYLIERKIGDRGVRRLPDEPLRAWLERATREPALREVADPLKELLRLHYCYRFDPRSLSPADRAQLRRGAEQVLTAIAKPRTR